MNFSKKIQWLIVIAFVLFMFYKPILGFLLIGSLLLFYVIKYCFFFNNINKNGKETTGKILSYETEYEGHKTPLVEFEINKKKIIKKPYYYSSTDLSIFKTYKNKIDIIIPIAYLPENPEKFIIKSEKAFNYFSLIFSAIVGVVFILISFAQLFNFINIENMN